MTFRVAGLEIPREPPPVLVVEALGHQRRQLMAEDVLRLVAEHAAGAVVPERDAAVLLRRDDCVVDGLRDRLEAAGGVAQLLLHPPALGDVLHLRMK